LDAFVSPEPRTFGVMKMQNYPKRVLSARVSRLCSSLPRNGIISLILWCAAIGTSLTWSLHQVNRSIHDTAYHQAHATYDTNQALWEPLHGRACIAFYVTSKTDDYVDNQFVHRHVTLQNGARELELVNFPLFTRHFLMEAAMDSGQRLHRTSLNPISDNSPDAWETASLKAFQQGATHAVSAESVHGETCFRAMYPLKAQEFCLRCHNVKKAGDLVGGISVTVPMAPLIQAAEPTRLAIWIGHLAVGLVGAALISFFTWRDQRRVARLHDSEQRYVSLSENLPVGVFRLTPDSPLRLEMANAVMAQMFGFAAAGELCRLDFADLFADPNDAGRFLQRLESQNAVAAKEVRARRQDGTTFWVSIMVHVVCDSQTQNACLDGVVEDITERKQADAELAAMNARLIETSRKAGMAEIAINVMHNVGNALNSVNVSSQLVLQRVRRSCVADLAKAAQLLEEHRDNLAEYVTRDERGRHFTDFLIELSRQMMEEEKSVADELETLLQSVEHVNQIVACQQSHASVSGLTEKISLTDLADDAIRINTASLNRHQIELVRDFQNLPPVIVDRNKLLQIVNNLLSNAKQAVCHNEPDRRRITVRVRPSQPNRVRLEVEDNGVGIAAENLTQIFAHGFTTRNDGHGFGLHSAALNAHDMGGSLTAYSDGPGTGARFTLELPLQCEVAS